MQSSRINLIRPSQMFDSFMDEFFNAPISTSGVSSVNVNVYEEGDNVMVEFTAPGFSKDQIEIQAENDVLIISGEIKEEKEESEDDRKYYIKEYKTEKFKRVINLPSVVDEDNSKASFSDGKVVVTLPKKNSSGSKKIEIS